MATKAKTKKPQAPAKKKERVLHGRNDATGSNSDAKKSTSVIKVDKAADTAAKIEAGEKKLVPIAAEINARFEKAEQAEGKAQDHRLAAALKLEEARKIAEASGIKIKEWAEKHIKQSYETVRKLIAVAQSAEPAKAIADLRTKNAEANKRHRANKKANTRTPVETKSVPPARRALEALSGCKDDEALKIAKGKVEELGFSVLSRGEAEKLRAIAKTPVAPDAKSLGFEGLKNGFTALRASEKMPFLRWAAGEVGAEVKVPLGLGEATEDLQDLGPFDRTKK